MAHLIENNTQTGKAEIAYANSTPWHGLGQQLTQNAPINVWRKEAGLEWDAEVTPVRFEPHGPGNMQPVFLSKNIYAADFRVLKEKHLKLKLVDPLSEIYLDAIAFNLADKIDDIAAGLPFDIVFTLEINKWKDRETIQLNVRDIRSSV